MKVNLLIFLAVWKRPHITEVCFKGIQRLKKHNGYNINALAVISEDSIIPLCEKYGISWTMYKNEPLGEKKNHGLSVAKDFDFDYLMEIGSDDIILDDLLTDYLNYVGKHDIFGVVDAAYIDSTTNECRRLISKHSTYGAGRMIHRNVLKRMGWKLWKDDLMKGMDNNSLSSLRKVGYEYHKIAPMDFPGVIDIKSDFNIWKFNYFLGQSYSIEEVFKRISPEEKQMIENYVVPG